MRKTVLALLAVVALLALTSDAKAFFPFHRRPLVVNNFIGTVPARPAVAVAAPGVNIAVGGRFARPARFVRGGFRGGFAFAGRAGFARFRR